MKFICYVRTTPGFPVVFSTVCYYLSCNLVLFFSKKYNVHSLIYSKPIFEQKRELKNKKIFE